MIQPIGHFRVWRELYTKPIWLNSTIEQQVILMTLMAMANFKGNQWEWKGEKFTLQPGQFITSTKSIIENTGGNVTIQNVRTALNRFEKLEFLTNESTKQGRLITLVNWRDYQYIEGQPNQAPNQRVTEAQPRGNRDLTTIEEGKKDREGKKAIIDIGDSSSVYKKCLETLSKIKDYPFDTEKDLKYIQNMEERYPSLDLVQGINKFSAYILDRPFKNNSNHRSQLNTSLSKYDEWGSCKKTKINSDFNTDNENPFIPRNKEG